MAVVPTLYISKVANTLLPAFVSKLSRLSRAIIPKFSPSFPVHLADCPPKMTHGPNTGPVITSG